MTTINKVMSIAVDGSGDMSADEMRTLLDTIETHLKSKNSPAAAAELLGVLSLRQCGECLDSDGEAEAMRRGFRLALYLAKFDFPLVQKALRQERQKKSVASKLARSQERKETIIRDYLELLETCEHIEAVTKLAKKNGQTKRYIRDIVMPSKPK